MTGPPDADDGPADYQGPWDDGLADVVAAVRAVRDDDFEGVGVLLRHGDRDLMLCVAVKLLAEATADVPPDEFRHWAARAVNWT